MSHKKLLLRMTGLASVLLQLVACGALQPTASPLPILPTSTPQPTESTTPTTTPTVMPTPTPDLNLTLLPTAGPLCEAAFASLLGVGSPALPLVCLLNKEYEPGWQVAFQQALPFRAPPPSEVKTLVCITEGQTYLGSYSDGTDAYKVTWEVRLVSWPDGTVLGAETLSDEPPLTKYGPGDVYGDPREALAEWLVRILGDRTLLFAGIDVFSIAFSPDGKTLAVGGGESGDERVMLWDLAAGDETRTLSGSGDAVGAIAFSPDGRTLAWAPNNFDVRLLDMVAGEAVPATGGGTAKLYDRATGEEVMVRTLAGQGPIAFSPDGKTLASVLSPVGGDVQLWDLVTGQEVRTLTLLDARYDIVSSLAFSPDGKTLAVDVGDAVQLWDVATGQEMRTLRGSHIAFSPDGKTLATGSPMMLWDLATGQEVRSLGGHSEGVAAIAFAPDAMTLAELSGDTVTLWDVATGEAVRTLSGYTVSGASLSFSPDGRTLAVPCRLGVKLWDIVAGP